MSPRNDWDVLSPSNGKDSEEDQRIRKDAPRLKKGAVSLLDEACAGEPTELLESATQSV